MQWLADNWAVIAFGAWVAMNGINAFTSHYTTSAGWRKVLLFVAEMLSVLTSIDADDITKLPGQSKPPAKKEPQ